MRKYQLLLIAALLVLTACSSVDDVSAPDDSLQAVRLTAAQRSITMTRAADGYYTADTGFDGTETVRLYLGEESAVYNVGVADAEDSYHSPLTPATTRIYYPSGSDGAVTVWAVYPEASAPASALSGAAGTHVVAYDQTTEAGYKSSDLMHATKSVQLSEKTSSQLLTFSHRLVKLKLVINKASDVESITKIELLNVKRKATVAANGSGMTLSNLSTPSTDEYGDKILVCGTDDAITDTEPHTFVVLFPSQAWNNADFLELTDNNNATAVYQLTKGDWTAGAEYLMTLNVDASDLGLTSAITDWTSDGSVTSRPVNIPAIGDIAPQTYTGNPIEPTPDVYYNGSPLTKDTDYYFVYANNISVGTATITVVGLNTYAGKTATTTFQIVEAQP